MSKIELYHKRADELRKQMFECSATDGVVPEKFWTLQRELDKVNRNYRAYCKRHNICPGEPAWA